jgi:hypothetical protein
MRVLIPVAFLADPLSIPAQLHALPVAVLAGVGLVAIFRPTVSIAEFLFGGFFFGCRSKCHGRFIVARKRMNKARVVNRP